MSVRYADGNITSGRNEGKFVYCSAHCYPILHDNSWLFSEPKESDSLYPVTPQTVVRIDILASTTTGPSASNFVAGSLIGGVGLGAAAAMSTMGSTHTVKVTWRDDKGSKESIIKFNNSTGFQNFIGKLGSLMNQPNAATPVPSSPALSSPSISSADEILKFKQLMDAGIITQEEFEAKKKQLLGIENAVINTSEANNPNANYPEYYSVMITRFNDSRTGIAMSYMHYKHCDMNEAKQIVDRATLPFEFIGTTSKSEAEEVANKLSSAGTPVEIWQPKSDGGFVITKFKNGYAIDENQPKAEVVDLESKQKDPEVGDEIYFGTNNGQRMTWKVLERQGRMTLVITTDIVCNKQYHSDYTNITWSECTLRKWLNSDFINSYFTQEERDRILPWKIYNDDNPEYKTPGGVNTTDKVFCLSIEEANSLFANDQERSLGLWWLRSSGVCLTNVATVLRNGTVHPHGHGITQTYIGVRPALWLDITSSKWCEEAKKRFDEYWDAHSYERITLEAEQKELKDQIDSLNTSYNEQIAPLEKEMENVAISGKGEIDNLNARIKKLSDEKDALGIFKVKQKKVLEEQINLAEADIKAAQDKMTVAQAALKTKISGFHGKFQKELSPLQSRINSIDAELNRAR